NEYPNRGRNVRIRKSGQRVDGHFEVRGSLILPSAGLGGGAARVLSQLVGGLHVLLCVPERDPDSLTRRSVKEQREALETLALLVQRDDVRFDVPDDLVDL